MINKQIKKKDVDAFIEQLKKDYEIYGPVKRGNLILFDKISSFDELELSKPSDYPAKKLFLPDEQELFNYRLNKAEFNIEKNKRILFLNPCDANALLVLDKIFLDEYEDPYYKAARKNTLLFVIKCKEPGEHCFCTSLGTDKTTNYDLLFIDKPDKFIIFIGGDKARELTENNLFEGVMIEGEDEFVCKKTLNLPLDMESFFEHKEWKRFSNICLFCGACNIACPTCFCFDVNDEANIDLKSGKRVRRWQHCKLKDFTKVAGNEVFREERYKRFRHFIYHKLAYFKEKFGKHLCVGCGRCITVCPREIDMVKLVNELE